MNTSACPTSHTFYRLRRVLQRELDLELDRRDIRPEACLESLVPEAQRRRVWKQLRREGLGLPALSLSSDVRRSSLFRFLHTLAHWAVLVQSPAIFMATAPLGL